MNAENLSKMPTVEAMKGTINYLRCQIDSRRANMQQRMENYFNCLDDYSYGGLQDQVASNEISSFERAISSLEKQVETGKPFKDTFKQYCLLDQNDNVITDKIVLGQFGYCFVINKEDTATFVGMAKRMSTYEKKGYKLGVREIEYEYFYTTNYGKLGLVSVGEVLNTTLKVCTKIPESMGYTMPRELYFAINK